MTVFSILDGTPCQLFMAGTAPLNQFQTETLPGRWLTTDFEGACALQKPYPAERLRIVEAA